MKTFGIDCSSSKLDHVQDLAARLFLSLLIAPEKAPKILNRMENGSIPIHSFNEISSKQIENLVRKQDSDQDFQTKMANRVKAWETEFGPLSDEDYTYLFNSFNLKKENFVDPIGSINCPNAMANYVKQFVKGQDKAIDQLSLLFYMQHYCQKNKLSTKLNVPILLIGNTGVGKSETFRRFGEVCDCPFIRINTSELSPESWRGTHLDDILKCKLDKVEDKEKAKYTILVFHEFDKITHFGTSDIITEAGSSFDYDLMRDFMRLFEDNHPLILNQKYSLSSIDDDISELNIDNFLIVFDGAFSGIERLVEKRLNVGKTIGYGKSNQTLPNVDLKQFITSKDLIDWGYLPELVGRIGNIIVLNQLNVPTMIDIMKNGKDSILQEHIQFCAQNNIQLTFDDDALKCIAQKAVDSGLGFRNVKTILYKVTNAFYTDVLNRRDSLKGDHFNITEAYILNILNENQLNNNH